MSLYEFSYKTGSSFSSAISPKNDTCLSASFNDVVSFGSADISGINQTKLSWNGQVLIEQTAVLTPAGFGEVYLNSGDYYFKSGINYSEGILNKEISFRDSQNSSFFYNLKNDFRESPVSTGVNAAEKTTGLRNIMARIFSDRTGSITGLNSFEYFANGQKLYTGFASGSYRISGTPPLFYYDDSFSGKIFAIPKNTGIKNVTGEVADSFGGNYVESTVFGYINGASLHRKNWLEISTGVTLIKTGLQSIIFDPIQTIETIPL